MATLAGVGFPAPAFFLESETNMGFFSGLDIGSVVQNYQSDGFFGAASSLLSQKYANPAGAQPAPVAVAAASPPRNAAPVDEASTLPVVKTGLLDTLTKNPALLVGLLVVVGGGLYLAMRK